MDSLKLLTDKASKFENGEGKDALYYFIGIDADGDELGEVDREFCSCEDCIEESLNDYKERFLKNGETFDNDLGDFLDRVVDLEMCQEGSPERDDFEYCDNCGVLIFVSVIHTFTQEIDHWLEEEEIKVADLPNQDCYIIRELINSNVYPDRVEKLKKLIV